MLSRSGVPIRRSTPPRCWRGGWATVPRRPSEPVELLVGGGGTAGGTFLGSRRRRLGRCRRSTLTPLVISAGRSLAAGGGWVLALLSPGQWRRVAARRRATQGSESEPGLKRERAWAKRERAWARCFGRGGRSRRRRLPRFRTGTDGMRTRGSSSGGRRSRVLGRGLRVGERDPGLSTTGHRDGQRRLGCLQEVGRCVRLWSLVSVVERVDAPARVGGRRLCRVSQIPVPSPLQPREPPRRHHPRMPVDDAGRLRAPLADGPPFPAANRAAPQ